MRTMRCVVVFWTIVLANAACLRDAMAWGPHTRITKAALEVLPEMDHWKQVLGAENVAALESYCLLPDQRGQDLGAFYADDYLLIRAVPRHVGHTMPSVQEAFVPYYWRAIQALRTETPANACRQIGPLLHFVEDVGAPPHAKPKCPHHSELENWVNADLIDIRDYKPRLLGKTDDEALKGLLDRIAGLVVFSTERAERALPLVSAASPDRSKVEPILLESALESARVTADFLYTIFTIGLKPQAKGAGLSGTVTAGEFPLRNDRGARIVLVDTDFATLAVSSPKMPKGVGWQGTYEFHGLPAGSYRVLAYRTGSQRTLSAHVTLTTGDTKRLDLTLVPTEPAGNIVENPDARLSYLEKDVPDRWRAVTVGKSTAWTSTTARVKPKVTYRCGAVLKDPKARVKFSFSPAPGKKGGGISIVTLSLPPGETNPAEVRYTADAVRFSVSVHVQTTKPLAEAIQRVWVVPETTPAGGRPNP